jgi:chemotaxis family two-component system response regulator Rcp1
MDHSPVGRPMEILLVEDHLEDARVTIEALTAGSVRNRVSLVLNGEEAMRFLHREGVFARTPRPDLILLDMELPGKHGRQVLAEIREDEELKSILVVVMTASFVHKQVLKAQNLHVDAYMTKPVSWDKFINVVKALRRSLLEEVILPSLE